MTENNFLWYSEPNAAQPCWSCKYCKYDSFHNESWCTRKPPPEGLPMDLVVDKWGHCDGGSLVMKKSDPDKWMVKKETIISLIDEFAKEEDKEELKKALGLETQYTCSPILVPVTNGILSGIASVITVYFFRPIWNSITKLWYREEPEQITKVEKK